MTEPQASWSSSWHHKKMIRKSTGYLNNLPEMPEQNQIKSHHIRSSRKSRTKTEDKDLMRKRLSFLPSESIIKEVSHLTYRSLRRPRTPPDCCFRHKPSAAASEHHLNAVALPTILLVLILFGAITAKVTRFAVGRW